MTDPIPQSSNSKKRPGMVMTAAAFGTIATVLSALMGSLYFTLGVAVGAAIMTADIFMINRSVTGLLGEEPKDDKQAAKKRNKLIFQYVLKVLGLLVVLGVVIWKTNLSPAGLLIGITASIASPIYVGLRDADIEQ